MTTDTETIATDAKSNVKPVSFTPEPDFTNAIDRLFEQAEATKSDYEWWSKQAYWTLEEATALCLGMNPKYIQMEALEIYLKESHFAKKFASFKQTIARAITVGMLQQAIAPIEFIEWGKPRIIGLPKSLIGAVETFEKSLEKPINEKAILREKNNLQKALYLVAVKHLKYIPDTNNGAAAIISKLFSDAELSLSTNTARKYLQAGHALIEENKR